MRDMKPSQDHKFPRIFENFSDTKKKDKYIKEGVVITASEQRKTSKKALALKFSRCYNHAR